MVLSFCLPRLRHVGPKCQPIDLTFPRLPMKLIQRPSYAVPPFTARLPTEIDEGPPTVPSPSPPSPLTARIPAEMNDDISFFLFLGYLLQISYFKLLSTNSVIYNFISYTLLGDNLILYVALRVEQCYIKECYLRFKK